MRYRSTGYFFVLCGASVLGIGFASSNFFVYMLATVLSVGILTVVLPLVSAYLFALIPAMLAREAGLGRWIVAALALAGILAVGFGIPLAAGRAADQEIARIQSEDFETPALQRPRTIEFVHPLKSDGRRAPLAAASCDRICQTLLLNGEADRVVMTTTVGWDEQVLARVAYTLERRAACPPAFADAQTALLATVTALAEGHCIVPAVDSEAVTAVSVRDRILKPLNPSFGADERGFAIWVAEIRRFQIVNSAVTPPVPVFRRTEVKGQVISIPFATTAQGGFQFRPMTVRPVRHWVVSKPVVPEAELRRALGYELAAIAGYPPLDSRAIAQMVLDRPGDGLVGPALVPSLEAAMGEIGEKAQLDADDIALVRRLVDDYRIRTGEPYVRALFPHKDVAALLLPNLIARLEDATDATHWEYGGTAKLIMSLPPADFIPYRDRLKAVARRGEAWAKPIVLGLEKLPD